LQDTCSLGLIATGLLPVTNALGVVSDLLARAILCCYLKQNGLRIDTKYDHDLREAWTEGYMCSATCPAVVFGACIKAGGSRTFYSQ
jgi:hypothetical protein